MNLKQFKLTNDDEIIAEIVEGPHEESGDLVLRKVLKIQCAEDFEQNVRYYSFRPWMSFQDNSDELSVLNIGHIIGETLPSKSLVIQYAAAMKEVEKSAESRTELDLDALIDELKDLTFEEMEALVEEKLRAKKEAQNDSFMQDSAQPNIIHFRPTDTKH